MSNPSSHLWIETNLPFKDLPAHSQSVTLQYFTYISSSQIQIPREEKARENFTRSPAGFFYESTAFIFVLACWPPMWKKSEFLHFSPNYSAKKLSSCIISLSNPSQQCCSLRCLLQTLPLLSLSSVSLPHILTILLWQNDSDHSQAKAPFPLLLSFSKKQKNKIIRFPNSFFLPLVHLLTFSTRILVQITL